MKILHVLPTLVKGGAERVVVDLANHAAAQGHNVIVLAAYSVDETLLRKDLGPKVEVRYVYDRPLGPVSRYLWIGTWLKAHREWLLEQDIVHCHLSFGSAVGAGIALLRRRAQSSRPALVESYQAVGAPINPLKRWLHGRLALTRDAFVIMADDGYWGEFLDRYKGLYSQIIPNGIAVPDWKEVTPLERKQYRREIGLPDDCRYVISTLGRIVAERRPWMYLPIFRKVTDALGPNVHFVYAGCGPVEDRIRADADRFGIGNQVHFTGLVRNPALPFSITDVYATYNVGPVAGIATLEAVFSGLPVVAVQGYDGHDGRNDWISSDTDPQVIAMQVIALLKSPKARADRAARQRAHAIEHFTVAAMAAAYEKVYARALEIASGRPD